MTGTDRTAVTVERRDGVATLALVDVARRNSCNPVLVEQLTAACEALRHDHEIGAVVLRADGPVFSAGGDVDALLDPPADRTAVYRGFRALAALPVPVVAAVHAPAIGAGVNFLLACDVVVAGRSATFDPRFLDVGIHPGGAHLWRMEQRIGRQGTAALLLCGDVLTGEEAERSGLVWRCVPDEELHAVVDGLARRAAARPRELVRRTKVTLSLSRSLTDPGMAADLEQLAQDWSVTQPAYTEGVARLRARLGPDG